MNKKTILDINPKGKKCLVRVDFNVPIIEGKITGENRIRARCPPSNTLWIKAPK